MQTNYTIKREIEKIINDDNCFLKFFIPNYLFFFYSRPEINKS